MTIFIYCDSQYFTSKKYAVYLEWPKYTPGRAAQLIEYIELWHIWLSDDFQFDNRPVIHDFEISIQDLTQEHILWIDNAEICWYKDMVFYQIKTV